MTTQNLLGFHAVRARMQQAPDTIVQVFYDAKRRDRRKQQLIDLLQQANVEITPTNKAELDSLAQGGRHQGIVAIAQQLTLATDVFTLLDELADQEVLPFLLILDGVTDPHNLGACLRTADAAGVHAVIAPKDRAVGLTPVVRRVACGAAETVPYIQVTNLARTMRALKERDIWLYGTDDQAEQHLHEVDLKGQAMAWVMGAEGEGLRRLTKETCDALVQIPMRGQVESLNVSVATALCLYERVRQQE
ncbi:MAG TPA: 23S rRNA (guanosine(2251)-2'-O)-methyltransferase RlmB [Paenalcaligenes sp.]|nr:23S rRNA (guanosine(2251)-2'-O)-methyltransferase RlmB [Paenalcaligenes sp.]